MTDAEAQNWDALKELISEGHVISVKNGTSACSVLIIKWAKAENDNRIALRYLICPYSSSKTPIK